MGHRCPGVSTARLQVGPVHSWRGRAAASTCGWLTAMGVLFGTAGV
jgi:hypothetical protein